MKNASKQPVRNSPNSSVMEPVSKPPLSNLSSSFDPVVILKVELALSQIAEDQTSITKIYRTCIIWDLFRCISVAVVNPVGTWYIICNHVQGTAFYLLSPPVRNLPTSLPPAGFYQPSVRSHPTKLQSWRLIWKFLSQYSIPWSPLASSSAHRRRTQLCRILLPGITGSKCYKKIFLTVTDHELLDVSGSDAMLLQGAHEQRTKLLLLLLHRDAMQANIYTSIRKYLTIEFHFHSHSHIRSPYLHLCPPYSLLGLLHSCGHNWFGKCIWNQHLFSRKALSLSW